MNVTLLYNKGAYMSIPNPSSIRIIPSDDPTRVLPTVSSYFPVPHNLVIKHAVQHYGYIPKEEDFPHMYPGSEITPPQQMSWRPDSQRAPGESPPRNRAGGEVTLAAAAASMEDLDPPGRLTGLEKAALNALSSRPVNIPQQPQEEEIPDLSPPKPPRRNSDLTRSYASIPLCGTEDYLEAAKSAANAAYTAFHGYD